MSSEDLFKKHRTQGFVILIIVGIIYILIIPWVQELVEAPGNDWDLLGYGINGIFLFLGWTMVANVIYNHRGILKIEREKAKKEKERKDKELEGAQAAKKRNKELIKKYGEKDGLAVFLKKVQKGMSLEMVEDVIGKHTYKDGNDYYFGNPFNRKIVFNKDKLVEDKTFEDKIWLDMPVKMLIASWGNPGDKKESVTKSSVKQRLFFNGRENRQGGTSYEYQVDVENDLVVGWKELE